MSNAALAARKELIAHRLFDNGVTATPPTYKVIDTVGNKDWVVDVVLGPSTSSDSAILRDVLIAPYARQLVTDVRQPILLERSKQGKYTVVGRGKIMPGGIQMPEGSILEATYNRIEYNYADLKLVFVADLDVDAEAWGDKAWGEQGKPWQQLTMTDAFGNVVVGDGIDTATLYPSLVAAPTKKTTTIHTTITAKTWGPEGDPHALEWGVDAWGAPDQVVTKLES